MTSTKIKDKGTAVESPRQCITIPADALESAEERLKFRPVTVEAMKEIWPILRQEPGRTCDFSWGGLLMWAPLFDYEYAIFGDTLFIKGKLEEDMHSLAFSLPVGAMPLHEAIEVLRAWCVRHGEPLRFSAIPKYATFAFNELEPQAVRELPDWGDYLYNIEPLATLQGKKMAKKRNHVNKFESLYPDFQVDVLDNDNVSDARAVLEHSAHDADNDPLMAAEERKLTDRILTLFEEGKPGEMRGIVLYANQQPVAFTVGDVKGDTLFIHIEKADRSYPGAYEAVNKYFAQYMLRQYPELKWVNREDDAGDPGLRKAKLSYHPADILSKYDILF